MGRIRIGLSSWTDKSLLESGKFYPPGVDDAEGRLRYYASRFPDLVEVNSTLLLTTLGAQTLIRSAVVRTVGGV